jgi:hypothetical protein
LTCDSSIFLEEWDKNLNKKKKKQSAWTLCNVKFEVRSTAHSTAKFHPEKMFMPYTPSVSIQELGSRFSLSYIICN